jgi:opacity protein-like surface antigen
MNKLFLAFCLTLITSVFALAQTSGDYKKGELYVGYSNQQVDTGADSDSGNTVQDFFEDRRNFNGFEVSGVYNVSRYVGLKGDFSGAYRRENFSFPTGTGTTANTVSLRTKNSLYNVLGGVQFKNNSGTARVKPFAHVLAGIGHARTNVSDVSCSNSTVNCSVFTEDFSDSGLAGAFGGGLDIKLSDKVDLRAVQVDYNPIRIAGSIDHNVRFGVGLVFK